MFIALGIWEALKSHLLERLLALLRANNAIAELLDRLDGTLGQWWQMQPTMTEATMAALSRAVDDVAAALELINWAEMQKRQRQGLLAQWWQRGRDFAGQIINV